jgi:hypothetical protein
MHRQAISNRLLDTRLWRDPDHRPIEGVRDLPLWKNLDMLATRAMKTPAARQDLLEDMEDPLEAKQELLEAMEVRGVNLADLYRAWVLHSDPGMRCTAVMPLNPMFLQCCLVAKLCHLFNERDERSVQDIVADCKELEILDTPVDEMRWKEYQLTLQSLQLHWTRFAVNPCCPHPALEALLGKMLARLGYFVGHTFEEGGELDDLQACSRCLHDSSRLRLCDQQIVYCACALWSMCYSGWLQENAVLTQIPEGRRVEIEEAIKDRVAVYHHHIEAGNDSYFTATMYDDIMVGALLQYMHRFSGMFHSVSQVAYFHNPEYQRRRPPEGVEDLLRERPAIDKIPTLQQLYPDLELFHEGTSWAQLPRGGGVWMWVHTPGLVFLVKNQCGHDGGDVQRDILWSPDPYELLKIYVLSLNPMIFMCDSAGGGQSTHRDTHRDTPQS